MLRRLTRLHDSDDPLMASQLQRNTCKRWQRRASTAGSNWFTWLEEQGCGRHALVLLALA